MPRNETTNFVENAQSKIAEVEKQLLQEEVYNLSVRANRALKLRLKGINKRQLENEAVEAYMEALSQATNRDEFDAINKSGDHDDAIAILAGTKFDENFKSSK